MSNRVQILDCTLRDGAYVVGSEFGETAIKGIIYKLTSANINIVECGWLKNDEYVQGTSFFHLPSDVKVYLPDKRENTQYVVMIDWDRYDVEQLPTCDGQSIHAIRVVFPQKKFREGIAVGKRIKEKGYDVYYQAANTLAYSQKELEELAEEINKVKPVSLSIVDTFGAMYNEDLDRIVSVLENKLDRDIKLGFHSHNNKQLSFALSMHFIELMKKSGRDCIVDSSLCGMGRGAGNTTTELLANFLNEKYVADYDMNVIMDAIDMYMQVFQKEYKWGYSIPYFIAGMYCAHVNNIAYLLENHRTNSKDMRSIIESLSVEERRQYNYDLLENKYVEYQSKIVDDERVMADLSGQFKKRKIVLILPGKSIVQEYPKIKAYIECNDALVIGVNAISREYQYDYLFFSNAVRYDYAKEIYSDEFVKYPKILLSNIKTVPDEKEQIVNYNMIIKRGWDHFDNSGMMCLRLLHKLGVTDVAIAGFDGFSNKYSDSYCDESLPHIDPGKEWEALNEEIMDMISDFRKVTEGCMNISFITKSMFSEIGERI